MFRHIVFMLKEDCHITYASITTFKNELIIDLIALETKIIASFPAENMDKKGGFRL